MTRVRTMVSPSAVFFRVEMLGQSPSFVLNGDGDVPRPMFEEYREFSLALSLVGMADRVDQFVDHEGKGR